MLGNFDNARRCRSTAVAAGMLLLTACGVGQLENAATPVTAASTSQSSSSGSDGTGTGTPSPAASQTPTPATSSTPATQGNAPAMFNGTVEQLSLTPLSATFAVATDGNGVQILEVKLSDQAADCNQVANNEHHADSNSFWLRAPGSTFANQSFQLGGENTDAQSTATFYNLDSTCSDTLSDAASWATSGTLTFTTVGAQTAVGTFQATMGAQGDQVSGAFTATLCSALGTLITDPGQTRTCDSQ